MKKKHKIWLIVASSLLATIESTKAQSIVIEPQSGSSTSIALANVNTVTFVDNDQDLSVNETTQSTTYSLSNIKKIYFDLSQTTSITSASSLSALSLDNTISENSIGITVNNSTYSNTTIEIYDMTGKKISDHVLSNGYNNIDISRFTQGLYFIKADTSTLKFIKQ